VLSIAEARSGGPLSSGGRCPRASTRRCSTSSALSAHEARPRQSRSWREHGPTYAALAAFGLETKNEDIRVFHTLVTEPLRSAGASVVIADHVTKDREKRGRYSIGGQSKLASPKPTSD
jgi:hypothetical protein